MVVVWPGYYSPVTKRLIDLTDVDLERIIEQKLSEISLSMTPLDPEKPLTRKGAADLLGISLTQLDLLCRTKSDPIPFYYAGESRRFIRSDLLAWLRRQTTPPSSRSGG